VKAAKQFTMALRMDKKNTVVRTSEYVMPTISSNFVSESLFLPT
jgi:hypothetical protein